MAATSLVGIMVGSVLFGAWSDKKGYLFFFRFCPALILAASLFTFFTADLFGLVTGLFFMGLGIGGGSLLLIYMTSFAGVEQNLAQGINLLYFLPTAATALPAHVKNGYIEKAALLPAILAGLAGTALAAWAATAMEVGMLRKCFGVFLLVIGVRELFRK